MNRFDLSATFAYIASTSNFYNVNAVLISSRKMFDNDFITDKKYNMVLMPLYFHEFLYGSILYDLTDITYQSGDFLANQYALVTRIIDRVH